MGTGNEDAVCVQYIPETGQYVRYHSSHSKSPPMSEADWRQAEADRYARKNFPVIQSPPIIGRKQMTWHEWIAEIEAQGGTPAFGRPIEEILAAEKGDSKEQ
jgi:hypothetical protein